MAQFIPLDLEGQAEYSNANPPKIIYAGNSAQGDSSSGIGQPYVFVGEDYISVVADNDKALTVSPAYGTNVSGPFSMAAMPDQISIGGGYWRINPLVLSTLPSTTATPIPWLVRATPRLLEGKDAMSSSLSSIESSLKLV